MSVRSSASREARVWRDFCFRSRSFKTPADPRSAVAAPFPVPPAPSAVFSSSSSASLRAAVSSLASASALVTSSSAAA
ncbi:Uncharacterised protein [Mycobacteroides abscessus subsp. abscessus]|nr:Uncharacterised protein [Mycobacteroides abscessus subsp. abscessus]SKW34415.1 Uncharacterised protein [Mycobacteroides abscessus subsp. abscessus]